MLYSIIIISLKTMIHIVCSSMMTCTIFCVVIWRYHNTWRRGWRWRDWV